LISSQSHTHTHTHTHTLSLSLFFLENRKHALLLCMHPENNNFNKEEEIFEIQKFKERKRTLTQVLINKFKSEK